MYTAIPQIFLVVLHNYMICNLGPIYTYTDTCLYIKYKQDWYINSINSST